MSNGRFYSGRIYGHGSCDLCGDIYPRKSINQRICATHKTLWAKEKAKIKRRRSIAEGKCRNCFDQPRINKNFCMQCNMKQRKQAREWTAAHPEQVKLRYARNQETGLNAKYARRSYRNHTEKRIHKVVQRHYRERAALGHFTFAEWQLVVWVYGGQCAYCGVTPNRLERDHVIPLSKGGSNWIENIVPACKSCNSAKHNKLDWKPRGEVKHEAIAA